MKLKKGWADEPQEQPAEVQAAQEIQEVLGANVAPIFDGQIHRFPVPGDIGTEKSGWYVLYSDKVPAGAFGNWKDGEDWHCWHANGLSYQEHEHEFREIWESIRTQRQAELEKVRKAAVESCRAIWEGLSEASENNPYLIRKKVKPHGLRETPDGRLVMPIYIAGEIASLQYISPDGEKQFHPGGATGGGYFTIPAQGDARTEYIVEGYATGASVAEATGARVWVALNAGNLKKVAVYLRGQFPEGDLCIVGDNDKSGVGQKKGKEAADASGARLVIPPEFGDANDYAVAGKDLKELLEGRHLLKLTHWLDFCAKPQPINWLIKGWVQAAAQMMVFGASGSGKTFVVLDMALSIACPEITSWQGFPVKHGPVVYLAGEGYAGLRQRLAGWKADKGVTAGELIVSENTIDLDTGDLTHAMADIEASGVSPCLIVVDTLNRFMAGDENKAQDTRVMLDACGRLYQRFGCTVLLVHHTGVAQDAQTRARGSSAWRGAMDIELCVTSDQFPYLTLSQTKNKDSEMQSDMMLELESVDVPGWVDEDGEQIKTCVPKKMKYIEAEEEKLTVREHQLFMAYNKAAEQFGEFDKEGNFIGIKGGRWKEFFIQEIGDNISDSSINTLYKRAKQKLIKLQYIKKITDDRYIPDGLWALWECKYLTHILGGTGGTRGNI